VVLETETIEKELGGLPQVVEGRLSQTLAMGIRHADAARLEREIDRTDLDADRKDVVVEELEAARERQDALRANKGKLQDLLKESKDWVGLDDAHFRAAISCGLDLLGAASLKEAAAGRFVFPAVGQRHGGGPSLAGTPA